MFHHRVHHNHIGSDRRYIYGLENRMTLVEEALVGFRDCLLYLRLASRQKPLGRTKHSITRKQRNPLFVRAVAPLSCDERKCYPSEAGQKQTSA
jgi:hypothetical protein